MAISEATESKIKEILENLRPYIQEDGGDVEFNRIDDDKVVWITLQGACSGCGSALATLKLGIERRIMDECPEITAVEAELG